MKQSLDSFSFIVLRCKEIVFARSTKKPKFPQKARNAVLRKYSQATGHICFISCQHQRVVCYLTTCMQRFLLLELKDILCQCKMLTPTLFTSLFILKLKGLKYDS